MKFANVFSTLVVMFLTTMVANGQVSPPPPPMTNGGDVSNNGMRHLNVAISGSVLSIHSTSPPVTPLTMMSSHGIDYSPDKFNVLEDVYFNAQNGWLPDGLFTELPAEGAIWIKRTSASQPVGGRLRVFEGGNMTEGMDAWTMSELYAFDGATWRWDGAMQHDYYTADMPGAYAMSFEVYVGDGNGDPIAGYEPASTTVNFVAVPEPAALTLVGVAGSLLVMIQRRRCDRRQSAS